MFQLEEILSLIHILQCENSITGQYLSGRKKIDVPTKRRKGNGLFLEIKGAQENNLKNVNVKFPLGTLTVVTGVSGSGKSSLVNEILCKAVQHSLGRTRIKPGKHKAILGLENIDKVIEISQDPIGRTPRSNPVTYTGVFDDIRDLFTQKMCIRDRSPCVAYVNKEAGLLNKSLSISFQSRKIS